MSSILGKKESSTNSSLGLKNSISACADIFKINFTHANSKILLDCFNNFESIGNIPFLDTQGLEFRVTKNTKSSNLKLGKEF